MGRELGEVQKKGEKPGNQFNQNFGGVRREKSAGGRTDESRSKLNFRAF